MKNCLKILLIILIIVGTLLADGTQPLGNGTESDPYLVSSMQHLIWISTNPSSWNSNFLQTANIDIIEIDDYDGGLGFKPIGNENTPFKGNYDGGGFTIDYLYIDRPNHNFVGLFGFTMQCTIKNLGITNATIVGYENVGTLSGYCRESEIINCYSSASVAGSIKGINNYVGGLLGFIQQTYVSNCYSTMWVEGNNGYVGGLIGDIYYNNSISNCYSTGDVSGKYYVGGFTGHNQLSTINSCYSEGSVTASQSYAGGFVGVNDTDGQISNCFCRGDVTRSAGGVSPFSAFCGYNMHNIENCYSTGSVFYDSGSNPTNLGFSGGGDGAYISNFWDSEASNQETALGATGLTSGDAQNFTAYIDAGWDFIGETVNGTNDYWNIDYAGLAKVIGKIQSPSAINDGYPIFSWQSSAIPEIRIFVNRDEFYNGQGYDFGSFVLPGQTYDVDVIVENIGTADLYLFPLPEIVTPYTSYFEFVTQPTSPVPPSGNTEFTVRLTIPSGFPKIKEPIYSTSIDIASNDIDENPFRILLGAGSIIEMDTEDEQTAIPSKFSILPAYPNPFNPGTTIIYGLDKDRNVNIQIYDINGKLISTLNDKEKKQGWHSVKWNGKNQKGELVPAGMYLCKVVAGEEIKTTKLMLTK